MSSATAQRARIPGRSGPPPSARSAARPGAKQCWRSKRMRGKPCSPFIVREHSRSLMRRTEAPRAQPARAAASDAKPGHQQCTRLNASIHAHPVPHPSVEQRSGSWAPAMQSFSRRNEGFIIRRFCRRIPGFTRWNGSTAGRRAAVSTEKTWRMSAVFPELSGLPPDASAGSPHRTQ
jgi:hypothetical protein